MNEATDIRRAARDGRDLIRELQQQRAKAVTFRQAFEAYYANREKTLSNSKHRQQWSSTIETYVYPKIGDLPVSDVTHADVLGILEPIWFDNAETARRVLQRMVFKAAIVLGQRERASPCVGIMQTLGIRHVAAHAFTKNVILGLEWQRIDFGTSDVVTLKATNSGILTEKLKADHKRPGSTSSSSVVDLAA